MDREQRRYQYDQESQEFDEDTEKYLQAILYNMDEHNEELQLSLKELALLHPKYQKIYDFAEQFQEAINDYIDYGNIKDVQKEIEKSLIDYRKIVGKEDMSLQAFKQYVDTKFSPRVVTMGTLKVDHDTLSLDYEGQTLTLDNDMSYHSFKNLCIGLQLKDHHLIIHCQSALYVTFTLVIDDKISLSSSPIDINKEGITYQIDIPALDQKDYSYQLIVGKEV